MKSLAYIATRETSYSRVALIRNALHQVFEVEDFVSDHRSYKQRFASVFKQLIVAWMTGRLRRKDALFVGFFAQPIFPLVRRLYKGPIVSDAYFSAFDTLVHDKQRVSPASLAGRLSHWLDAYMLRNSDLCLADTAAHIDYFRSQFNVPRARLARLWISALTQPISTAAAARQTPGSSSRPFRVIFWGGFIPLQGVETIVQAAAFTSDPEIEFVLIGAGQTLQACEQIQRSQGARNIRFTGWKSPSEVQSMAADADLALGIFGTTDKAARVIPNKVFEALAMGLPLITRDSPAIRELLTPERDVFCVPAGDPRALAAKIVWLKKHSGLARQAALRGQKVFQRKASPDCVSQLLHGYIQKSVFDAWSRSPQFSPGAVRSGDSDSSALRRASTL